MVTFPKTKKQSKQLKVPITVILFVCPSDQPRFQAMLQNHNLSFPRKNMFLFEHVEEKSVLFKTIR